jgi:hypothetical protein
MKFEISPKLDSDTQMMTIALMCNEIIRLKSLCYKASELLRIEDDESQNLHDALIFKASADFVSEYGNLVAEQKEVFEEIAKIFGPEIESFQEYSNFVQRCGTIAPKDKE